jgi:hypothetical protein
MALFSGSGHLPCRRLVGLFLAQFPVGVRLGVTEYALLGDALDVVTSPMCAPLGYPFNERLDIFEYFD